MSAAAFPSPAAEMAEMNRLQYELDYTEGISQRMRIPEMLKVAPQTREDPAAATLMGSQDVHHSVIMQVPERIVVAGQSVGLEINAARQKCGHKVLADGFSFIFFRHTNLRILVLYLMSSSSIFRVESSE